MKRTVFLLVFLFSACTVYAQLEGLHGEFDEYRPGVHSGNQIRLAIWNDGQVGTNNLRQEFIALEWPINTGFAYFGQSMIKVGAEVFDVEGDLRHIFSESNGWRPEDPNDPGSGDMGPDGEWWTFLPLPGFANPEEDRIAMSHWKWSWPASWPDKSEDQVDPGWPGKWNGYFGKNVTNADQESYFVMDDYHNKEFAFYPDSTDQERRGLGMRVTARGFQWSNALVEDIYFALYDVKNISTTNYAKILFAQFVGAAIGNTITQGGDNGDDNGSYVLEESLVYSFDEDNLGSTGWTPVGYYGCAFLESPGNPFDGIDNDYDAEAGNGKQITEDLFVARTLNAGGDVIVIDYKNHKRTKISMPNDTLKVEYRDRMLKFRPGQTVEEIPHNLVDDNLNGLIDENNGSTLESGGTVITRYLYIGNTYVDYFDGTGADNPLIDEYRDDGIDNDKDWNPLLDDLGLDGVAFTGDFGEGDGLPTSGWQPEGTLPGLTGPPNIFGLVDTNLPGEPHIDKTDIDESDMIGLTSFYLYTPWSLLPASDDELIWEKTRPGYLDDRSQNSDTDFTFGSGYFPMNVGQIERFSIAHVMGIDFDDMVLNKQWGDRAYTENYNFAKAPNIPTVTAIPGDNMVTLVWDDFAEKSVDPILGEDFEGYRIYRSTDPGWNDMVPITDAHGTTIFRHPLAQFDLVNEYEGYGAVPIKGAQFYLGDNTGIVHTYTDSTAKNGQTYYYAVTSYDHGDPANFLAPTECTKYIAISTSGEVDRGTNVVIARPEAPSAGFIPANMDTARLLAGGTANGRVGFEMINPDSIKDKHTYRITFEDTLDVVSSRYTLATKSVSLLDVTDAPVTLVDRVPFTDLTLKLPVVDGYIVKLANQPGLDVNTAQSGWNREGINDFEFEAFKYSRTMGVPVASDYRIEFGEVGMDTSTYAEISRTRKLDAIAVNFQILNTTRNEKIDFALWEKDGAGGIFSAFTERNSSDIIIFLEKDKNDSLVFTWEFGLDTATNDSLHENPQAGDFVDIRLNKPFLSQDVFEFQAHAAAIDDQLAKTEMDQIRVVPNPYVVANSWEPQNPYSNGRGPRELHFTHLPARCTIRIFNIRGQLVRTIEHDTPNIANGTEIWDMLSKDNLDISYGVYVYHVDAGKAGQKIGKFAVIK